MRWSGLLSAAFFMCVDLVLGNVFGGDLRFVF
jgi:hypothetical protein